LRVRTLLHSLIRRSILHPDDFAISVRLECVRLSLSFFELSIANVLLQKTIAAEIIYIFICIPGM